MYLLSFAVVEFVHRVDAEFPG